MSITIHAGPAARPGLERAANQPLTGARVPAGLRFEGEAHFPCDLTVDGVLHGTITLAPQALLAVAPMGAAEGTFRSGHARIEGSIKGELDCSEGAVEFTATARGQVKVLYSELGVARGAEIEADLHRARGPSHV